MPFQGTARVAETRATIENKTTNQQFTANLFQTHVSLGHVGLALIFLIGSRPSDHYFRSVCLSVCLFVCAEFFSAVFDPIWIKLGHMLHVRV